MENQREKHIFISSEMSTNSFIMDEELIDIKLLLLKGNEFTNELQDPLHLPSPTEYQRESSAFEINCNVQKTTITTDVNNNKTPCNENEINQSLKVTQAKTPKVNNCKVKNRLAKDEKKSSSNYLREEANSLIMNTAAERSGQDPFQCQICLKVFTSKSGVKSHLLTHSDECRFSCDQCPKSFRLPQVLARHKLTHVEEKPFRCKECPKTFRYLQVMERHMTLHSNQLKYQCQQCPKSFRLPIYLQEHQRIHSEERPFRCDLCEKSFRQSKTLKIHKLTHTDDRPFMCEICAGRFRSRKNLKLHLSLHG